MKNILLEIKNLSVSFFTDYGEIKAVRNLNLTIKKGETVGIVGESGCGKTITALSILNLVPAPGKILQGEIKFENKNILSLNNEKLREIRGKKISIIFQDPMASLNPVLKIGEQLSEVFVFHTELKKDKIKEKVLKLLKNVKIPNPEIVYNSYPHQLSGGMQQRVMIAMALALNPKILIADEPTTSLDVTIESEILKLLYSLKKKYNLSILFITHNMALLSQIADRIYVMYAGEIVEEAKKEELFKKPLHPYTKALLEAIPGYKNNYKKLNYIPGEIPNNINILPGCTFYPRCKFRKKICYEKDIEIFEKSKNHFVRCVL
jgi:oligopeptide/dipeptide ABC transporter ATP-binding protein